MGDIIHALPALSDAAAALPDARFDWLAEHSFHEIPGWHPAVSDVLTVALRRWRRAPFSHDSRLQWREARRQLKRQYYDHVIDAQGLLKSALLARFARGQISGPGLRSARERMAALLYHRRIEIGRRDHIIPRLRSLFAAALDYPLPDTPCDYGLDSQQFRSTRQSLHALVFIHASSRIAKEWPSEHWQSLGRLATRAGYRISLPWGTDREKRAAERIAAGHPAIRVLPKLSLTVLARVIADAEAVVAVDTGLAHMAAALRRPVVSLYGRGSNPQLVGATGSAPQLHLQAADGNIESIGAEQVWQSLQQLISAPADSDSSKIRPGDITG